MTPIPPLSLPRRIVGAFSSPGAVGDSLATSPRWLWTTVLCMLLSCATSATFFLLPSGKKILLDEMRKSMPAQSGAATEENPIEKAWPMVVGFGIGGSLVVPPLLLLLCAAILWVVCTALLGSSLGYRHHFAIASHTYLIFIAGGILTTALFLARGSTDATVSLAAFAPSPSETSLLHRALSLFDFFRVWWIASTGVMAARAGRLGTGSVLAALFLVYLFLGGLAVAAQVLLSPGSTT